MNLMVVESADCVDMLLSIISVGPHTSYAKSRRHMRRQTLSHLSLTLDKETIPSEPLSMTYSM